MATGGPFGRTGRSPRYSSTLVRRTLVCFVSIALLLITRWYVAGESRPGRFGEQETHTLKRDSEGLTEPWNAVRFFLDCFISHLVIP